MRRDRANAQGRAVLRRRNAYRPRLEVVEPRVLLANFTVNTTADTAASWPPYLAPGHHRSQRQPGPDTISFNIPASTAPNLDVPVPGFDPTTQTWTIKPATPLPTITDQVSIDGYSQARIPGPVPYKSAISSASQTISVVGGPTGGHSRSRRQPIFRCSGTGPRTRSISTPRRPRYWPG